MNKYQSLVDRLCIFDLEILNDAVFRYQNIDTKTWIIFREMAYFSVFFSILLKSFYSVCVAVKHLSNSDKLLVQGGSQKCLKLHERGSTNIAVTRASFNNSEKTSYQMK